MGKAPLRTAFVRDANGAAIRVEAGERFTITDVLGGQVATLFLLCPTDMREHFSASHTRVASGRHDIAVGASLYNNNRLEIAVLEEDSTQAHNMLLPACRARMDDEGPVQRSCQGNLESALAEFHTELITVPDPIHLFQPLTIQDDGTLIRGESASGRGDRLGLRAVQSLLAVVSSCPSVRTTPVDGHGLVLDVWAP